MISTRVFEVLGRTYVRAAFTGHVPREGVFQLMEDFPYLIQGLSVLLGEDLEERVVTRDDLMLGIPACTTSGGNREVFIGKLQHLKRILYDNPL